MQFNEKDIDHLLRACAFYKYNFPNETYYDTLEHKLHSYEEEYDCPGCWDPTAEHTCKIA